VNKSPYDYLVLDCMKCFLLSSTSAAAGDVLLQGVNKRRKSIECCAIYLSVEDGFKEIE
jgi:hypothetical protein